jgi:predicted CoA-binding protein
MSEPAKDEAELIERILQAIWDGCDEGLAEANPAIDAIAAIRAAGWAVVPVEPTFNMESEGSVAMVKLGYLPSPGEVAEIYRAMIAAAPGVKP